MHHRNGFGARRDRCLDQALVDLIYLPRNSQVKPGASIVTSGQGGVFPRGIPIGTVMSRLARARLGLSRVIGDTASGNVVRLG